MTSLRSIFLSALFCTAMPLSWPVASAQASLPPGGGYGYSVEHFTEREGLASNMCYILKRDERGFLWIATPYGLCRFDGRLFTVFTTRDGLLDNAATGVCFDTSGLLYVSSNSGICRYTGDGGHPFVALRLPKGVHGTDEFCPVDSDHIYIPDRTGQSLYLMDRGRLRLVPGFAAQPVGMVRGADGFLYVLTALDQIIAIRDTQVVGSADLGHMKDPPGKKFFKFLEKDELGQVLLKGSGLYLLDGRGPFLKTYRPPQGSEPVYNWSTTKYGAYIGHLHHWVDSGWQEVPTQQRIDYGGDPVSYGENSLAFLTRKGLSIFHRKYFREAPKNKLLFYYTTTPDGRRDIHHDSSLYLDRPVRRYYHRLGPDINNIYKGRDGTVWFCCIDAVYYLPKGHAPLLRYPGSPREYGFFNKAIEDRDGKVWFETHMGKVCYDSGRFRAWRRGDYPAEAIYSNAIDGHGTYYAAGFGIDAFPHLQPKDISRESGIGNDMVRSMCPDLDGCLWASTNSNRLIKVGNDGKGHFNMAGSLELGFNGRPFSAQSIVFDRNGNLWAASDGRLSIYFRQRDGSFTDGQKMVLGKQQLGDLDFGESRPYLAADSGRGHIYLGTDTSWAIFDAAEVVARHRRHPPAIVLTGVRLSGKAVDWGPMGYATDRYGLPVTPRLPCDQNSISFSFAGMTDNEPGAVAYRYRLEGFDGSWQDVTQTGGANYTNLAEGRYVFLVMAADIDGSWSRPLAFPFSIRPHWYNTWWAWALWGMAFTAGISVLVRTVKAGEKKREGIKRLLVEQQLKALRAQINPHFLQNTFDFLSHAMQNQPVQKTKQTILQLSTYLRNALDMGDLTVTTLEEELGFATEYLAVNRMLFNDRFTYGVCVDDDVDVFGIRVPSLLMQPILENAIKHGVMGATGSGTHIAVRIYRDALFAYCAVSNSMEGGALPGGPSNHKPLGLSITDQRLKLLHGDKKHKPSVFVSRSEKIYEVTIKIPL